MIFTGQPSQMYVTRSQTEDSKLDYTAYSTQQATGTQHLAQQTNYLSESDFGSHVSAAPTSAKEEPTLFSVTSQPPQQSPLASTPTDNDQQQQQQQQQQDQQPQQNPDGTVTVPTLADYNQSTSKGHEILSQVS